MIKKIISLFTLTAFVVFTFSCYSTKIEKIGSDVSYKGKTRILSVLTKSGERFEFPKGEPGRIFGDKIVGEAVDEAIGSKPVSIPISDVDVVWVKKADTGKIGLAFLGRTVITISVVSIIYLLIWLIKNIRKHHRP